MADKQVGQRSGLIHFWNPIFTARLRGRAGKLTKFLERGNLGVQNYKTYSAYTSEEFMGDPPNRWLPCLFTLTSSFPAHCM